MTDRLRDPATLRAVRDKLRALETAETDFTSAILAAASNGWPYDDIGHSAGLSRQRIGQIVSKSTSHGRLVLAPDVNESASAVVCVIEKVDADRGRPAIARTTLDAVDELTELARGYDLSIKRLSVPAGGQDLDLNQPNLIVMIGPRSSQLVAQAISADPVIKWRSNKAGDWYIIDTTTGREYHSDFDRGGNEELKVRYCYAHLGRIRRPDGNGTWLAVAGEHAPGVAGAAKYLCREIESLWKLGGVGLWSGIVRVTVGQDGAITDTGLKTQIYVHGRKATS